MEYRIAICDDSAADSGYIEKLVCAWANERNVVARVDAFASAEAFLFNYADDKGFDILLLDIEMRAMNGVELAKRIRAQNASVQIVFITGYPDFISEGYEVAAINYLMKPLDARKLASALDRAVKNLEKREKSIIFNVDGDTVRVAAGDIMCVEAFAHSCTVTTIHGAFDVKLSISSVEKLLGEGFARCHRSYIVGIRYIKCISKSEITLDSGAKIPLSRANYLDVNQMFIRYFKGDM